MYINPNSAPSQVLAYSTSPAQWLLVQVSCLRPWWLLMLAAIIAEGPPVEPLLVWVIDYKEPPGFVWQMWIHAI